LKPDPDIFSPGRKEENNEFIETSFRSFSFVRKPQGSRLPSCKIMPGRKRNKTPERHYSWSINASIAKSNKLAFSKLQTTFDFALFSANRRSLRCECSVLNCSK